MCALASATAAEIYVLPILVHNIQDNDHNQKRFLIIGATKMSPTGWIKLLLPLPSRRDCPGSLFNVMKAFVESGINLMRVESRPAKQNLSKDIFYIDFAGHWQDEKSTDSLRKINRQVCWLKIFGYYPVETRNELFI